MNMGQSFWDLSDKERAALTDERMAYLERVELMAAGVLVTEPLVVEEEPPVPLPDVEVYDVNNGQYGHETIATFATMDAARAFVALRPIVEETHWLGGTMIRAVKAPAEIIVVTRRTHSRDQFAEHQAAIKSVAAIRERNEKARTQHSRDSDAQAKALTGMRAEASRCRDLERRYQRIVSTFNQYVATAEDVEIAARFLGRAFPADEIAAAAEWSGVSGMVAAQAQAAE